jgi:hypothetical protein
LTDLSPLQVTALHLRVLAKIQNDAADGIWNAWTTVSNVGEKVATSHGSICSSTASAVKNAEIEREEANRLTQAQSKDLAVKLDHAADMYDEIDAQEKANVDKQMLPGG